MITMCRWMLVGCYVGFATVGAFASWYMYTSFMGIDLSADGHSTVTWQQLTHWNQCKSWPDFQVSQLLHALFHSVQVSFMRILFFHV